MSGPSAVHQTNVKYSQSAAGPSGASAGTNSGLARVGSAGFGNVPLGIVGFAMAYSSGRSPPTTAATRSAVRSPGRSGTPVGYSPIIPMPASTLAWPTSARIRATTQAYGAG